MTWIPSHQELREHPKLRRLARLLDTPPVHLCGHLHFLWYWVLDYAADGDLADFDAVDIAEAASWDGDAEAFVQALVDCGPGDSKGLLERTRGGKLIVHDWNDHGGSQFRKRALAAERKRKQRASEQEKEDASQGRHTDMSLESRGRHADVTRDKRDCHAGEDREERTEKRGEDIPKEDAAAVAGAREDDAPPADEERSSSIGDETPESPPPKSPDPMDDDDPMDALLLELWEVEGWKRKPKQDREDLARLGAAFPQADLAVAIQQLRAKALDGAVKANPRSALQAFIKQLHLQAPAPRSYPEEDEDGPRPIADWGTQAECAKEAAAVARRLAAGGRA
ncbi:MAG: hypothetical protein ACYC6T_08110 [Thermoleophilia bacterium]